MGKNDARWNKTAADLLVGRTITAVSYMDADEADNSGFVSRPVAIQLDNGLVIFPQSDDEGNDGGALVCFDAKAMSETLLPTLR
jgi:hypothetical protein